MRRLFPAPRRGAGVVEQGCLLSSYTGKTGVGGSNPPLSATVILALTLGHKFFQSADVLARFAS